MTPDPNREEEIRARLKFSDSAYDDEDIAYLLTRIDALEKVAEAAKALASEASFTPVNDDPFGLRELAEALRAALDQFLSLRGKEKP